MAGFACGDDRFGCGRFSVGKQNLVGGKFKIAIGVRAVVASVIAGVVALYKNKAVARGQACRFIHIAHGDTVLAHGQNLYKIAVRQYEFGYSAPGVGVKHGVFVKNTGIFLRCRTALRSCGCILPVGILRCGRKILSDGYYILLGSRRIILRIARQNALRTDLHCKNAKRKRYTKY